MARLALPANEMNRYDLPEVCLVTGAREGVTFRRIGFQWFPRWLPLLVVLTLVIGAIILALSIKTAHGELPFSDEGWRRHRTARALNLLAGVLLVVGVIGAILAGALDHEAVAGTLVAFAFAVPLALYLGAVRGRAVTCRDIGPGLVYLEVPSAEAAKVVSAYRHAGAVVPVPAVPVPVGHAP